MDPTTLVLVLGFSGLLLSLLAAFVFHRSISGVRAASRYSAPPKY